MPQELQRITHVHQALIELALAGHTVQAIAQAMNRSPQSVSLLIRNPMVQEEMARRRNQQTRQIDQVAAGTLGAAKAKLLEASEKAVDVHIQLMSNSLDERVKQVSATEILKRTFDRSADQENKQGLGTIAVQLGPGAMLNLQIALREDAQMRGFVSSEDPNDEADLINETPSQTEGLSDPVGQNDIAANDGAERGPTSNSEPSQDSQAA